MECEIIDVIERKGVYDVKVEYDDGDVEQHTFKASQVKSGKYKELIRKRLERREEEKNKQKEIDKEELRNEKFKV